MFNGNLTLAYYPRLSALRRNCPFYRRRSGSLNARRREESNRMERETQPETERETERLVHLSTPFGRITVGPR
jgi:hypothetical protein